MFGARDELIATLRAEVAYLRDLNRELTNRLMIVSNRPDAVMDAPVEEPDLPAQTPEEQEDRERQTAEMIGAEARLELERSAKAGGFNPDVYRDV